MRARLSISQLINMNIGFLGIQYSFGLQQSAINPIYLYLNANPEDLPLLNLAGPVTGLLIQPIIGALSDHTYHPRWGRRKPYFLIGAVLCSLCLFLFPFSRALWMAVGLLWLLDAGNNTTMEPYRAFVADTIREDQQHQGFLMQSMFTGLGITLANFSIPFFQWVWKESEGGGIPTWVYGSFFVGTVICMTTILISVFRTPEVPLHEEQIAKIRSKPLKWHTPISEVIQSIGHMPRILWKLAGVYLFQWYALFIYWQFISLSIAKELFGVGLTPTGAIPADQSAQFTEAVGWTGIMNGTYNAVTALAALGLLTLVPRIGPRHLHAACLAVAAIGLIGLPDIHNEWMALIPMIGLGIAWASIMGIPYLIVVPHIPEEKYGVYMGIINMMIVVPMIIQTLSFGWVYEHVLDNDPSMAIRCAGVLLLVSAVFTLLLKHTGNRVLRSL